MNKPGRQSLVISKIDKPGKIFVPLNEIMDMSAKMTPVLVAGLNLSTGEVINVTMTSTTHYGDVPLPIFQSVHYENAHKKN